MHPELNKIFASHGLRLTKPRQTVFDILHASDTPLAISRIAKQAKEIDRVSVYRTIELFVELNIAEPVPVGWKQRYELTSPFQPHHHHLYCVKCGQLTDIHSKTLEQLVAAITAKYNFTPQEHKFEISGLCQQCRDASQ